MEKLPTCYLKNNKLLNNKENGGVWSNGKCKRKLLIEGEGIKGNHNNIKNQRIKKKHTNNQYVLRQIYYRENILHTDLLKMNNYFDPDKILIFYSKLDQGTAKLMKRFRKSSKVNGWYAQIAQIGSKQFAINSITNPIAIKFLLYHGMDIEIELNNKHETLLWLAVKNNAFATVLMLLEKKAQTNRKILRSKTNYEYPIHMALRNGNINIIKCLVDHGANLFEYTPFMHASMYGNFKIV